VASSPLRGQKEPRKHLNEEKVPVWQGYGAARLRTKRNGATKVERMGCMMQSWRENVS